jgi:arginase
MPDDTASESWDLIASPWHLDEYIPDFPVPAGAASIAGLTLPPGSPEARMTHMYRVAADVVAQAGRPLLLTGDCTAALAALAGLQRRHRDIGVVWLDAHGDFNTPAITISGYLAGMTLAMLTGRAPEPISGPLGLRPVADQDAILVDARELDPAERDALTASQVQRVPATPDAIRAALSGLGRKPIYLHVDADVIDGAELPGLRFPTAAGPSLAQIQDCLAAVLAASDVVAACLACTWLPGRVSEPATREAIITWVYVAGAGRPSGLTAWTVIGADQARSARRRWLRPAG